MQEIDRTGASGPRESSSPIPEIDSILQITNAKIAKHQARLELLETLEGIRHGGGDTSAITANDPRLEIPLSFWLSHAKEIVQATRPHAREPVEDVVRELFEKCLEEVRGASPASLKDMISEKQEKILRLAKTPIEEGIKNVAARRQTEEALTRLREKLRMTST